MLHLVRAVVGLSCVAVALGACRSSRKHEGPAALEPYRVTKKQMRTVLRAHWEVAQWHRDLVLTCPMPSSFSQAESIALAPRCSVFQTDGAGRLSPLDVGPVLSVQRAYGGRMLITRRNHDLILRDAAGEETLLARGALKPQVGRRGFRAVYRRLPEGVRRYGAGTPTRLYLVDLRTRVQRPVSSDSQARIGYPVPGSDDQRVVFVSSRSGVPALYLSSRGLERQLTNSGQVRITVDSFTPPPQGSVVWLGDGDHPTMVYSGTLRGRSYIYSYTLDAEARRLGPGKHPKLLRPRGLAAIVFDTAGYARPVRYLHGS